MGGERAVHKELIKRLKIRSIIEKSAFFQRHEIVGSSIFIVYDDDKMEFLKKYCNKLLSY